MIWREISAQVAPGKLGSAGGESGAPALFPGSLWLTLYTPPPRRAFPLKAGGRRRCPSP